MFERKLYKFLEEWKKKDNRKPLIIKGARQIGKTTLALDFAQKNYKNVVYLDLRKRVDLHEVFDGNFIVNEMTLLISSKMPDIEIIPYETVFIFDELQDCPNVRSALEYFALDGRYDVICTGSLLGIKGYKKTKKKNRGIPVGYEEVVLMKPLDFEEFLWANGIKKN